MSIKSKVIELALQNKYTDKEIAEMVGTKRGYVSNCRIENNIPTFKKLSLFEKLLGIKTDKEIANETGMTYNSVVRARLRRGVSPVKKTRYIQKTIREVCLGIYPFLGILPDKKIAEITNKSMQSAIKKRWKADILPAGERGERKLQNDFIKTLDKYSQYVKTPYGIIDVLSDNAIYELKTPLTTSASHSAVGQLLAYKNEYPNRSLFIVTDNKQINKHTEKHINSLGIIIIMIKK